MGGQVRGGKANSLAIMKRREGFFFLDAIKSGKFTYSTLPLSGASPLSLEPYVFSRAVWHPLEYVPDKHTLRGMRYR
jgi:hypothetical protein